MSVKKICVMADVLRTNRGRDGIISWLTGLMSGIISRITDIPFHYWSANELENMQKEIYKCYGMSIEKHYGLPYNFLAVPEKFWIDISLAEPTEDLLKIIKKYFNDCLVISREPSFLLKKSFDILKIPYVDLAIHPVRYLDDLIMGATSNIEIINNQIEKYIVNEELFYFHADIIKSEALFRQGLFNRKDTNKNIALLLGQTPIDRSLLDFKNKRLVKMLDFADEIDKLSKKHDLIYYKAHPHYNNKDLSLYKKYPNMEFLDVNLNTYSLLSLPQIKTCAAISSGTLKEAYYFGKETICFHQQPYLYSEDMRDETCKDNIYKTVGKEWLSAYFWADILSPIIKTKENIFKINTNNIHNKLRRILNQAWSYNDCDSVWANEKINKLNFKLNDNKSLIKDNQVVKKNYYFFGLKIMKVVRRLM